MDLFTALAIIVPGALSLTSSIIYAYIALKKAKESPKDEVWETALKLICSTDDCYSAADDFASLYLQLKFFKEHPEKLEGFTSIEHAMEAAKSSAQASSHQLE